MKHKFSIYDIEVINLYNKVITPELKEKIKIQLEKNKNWYKKWYQKKKK